MVISNFERKKSYLNERNNEIVIIRMICIHQDKIEIKGRAIGTPYQFVALSIIKKASQKRFAMRQKLDNLFRNNNHHLKPFVRDNRVIDRLSKYKIYERIRLATVR